MLKSISAPSELQIFVAANVMAIGFVAAKLIFLTQSCVLFLQLKK